LGFLLQLKAEAYLLIGIPLTLLFQLFIVRKPIHRLWLRDEEKFSLSKWRWLVILCFSIFPVYKTINDFAEERYGITHLVYNCAAIAGAFGAGYCYSKLTKKTVTDFIYCFLIIVLIRVSLYFLPLLTGKAGFDYERAFRSVLLYIPVAFIVEEVVFRGMLDTYVQPDNKPSGIWSALFISMLWGLWHLPLVANGKSLWTAALGSMTISLWGIILSIFWRRTGNLAIPGFSHAFADAIRDGLK
jgi:membrane protease YdiL (CAAX protease family)